MPFLLVFGRHIFELVAVDLGGTAVGTVGDAEVEGLGGGAVLGEGVVACTYFCPGWEMVVGDPPGDEAGLLGSWKPVAASC